MYRAAWRAATAVALDPFFKRSSVLIATESQSLVCMSSDLSSPRNRKNAFSNAPSAGMITSHPFATNRFTAFLAHIKAEMSTTTTLQSSASSSTSISTSPGLPRSSLGSPGGCCGGCGCGCSCRALASGLLAESPPFAFALACGAGDLMWAALTLFSSSAIWWLR